MDIWKLDCITNDYTPFVKVTDQATVGDIFLTDGTPKNWPTPPKCRPLVEKNKKNQMPLADLSYISPGTILLNGKAHKALKDFLLPFGQLLEVECMNEGGLLGDKASYPYYLYNVTNIIPCIDVDHSEKRGNSIKKEAFFPDRVPQDAQIFKDPLRIRVLIYLTESAKEQFAKLIADAQLTGGEFVKI